MKVDCYDYTGKKLEPVTLPKNVFEVPASEDLIAQAVSIYLTRQRQGTKAVKTRGQVSYSTHKIWKQKGTGRARHGSRKAPIFVGGGVSHGPTGLENYSPKLTQKMRHRALLGSLTLKAQDKKIVFIDDLSKLQPKTKDMMNLLKTVASYPDNQLLMILDEPYQAVLKSVKNLPKIQSTQVKRLNTYEVMKANTLVICQKAADYLTEQAK
jgi:large subunit ribosomal protein L4